MCSFSGLLLLGAKLHKEFVVYIKKESKQKAAKITSSNSCDHLKWVSWRGMSWALLAGFKQELQGPGMREPGVQSLVPQHLPEPPPSAADCAQKEK